MTNLNSRLSRLETQLGADSDVFILVNIDDSRRVSKEQFEKYADPDGITITVKGALI